MKTGYTIAKVRARNGSTALMIALQSNKSEGEIIGAKVIYIEPDKPDTNQV
jgi:hypothetical protein